MKLLLILVSAFAAFVLLMLGVYTFFFELDGWTINRRVEERREFCKAQPIEYYEELLEHSKNLIDIAEASDEPYGVAFLSEEYIQYVPDFILKIEPQSIFYRHGTLIIYLDKMMDLSAEFLVDSHTGEYRIIGRFGRSGFPTYEAITFIKQPIEPNKSLEDNSEELRTSSSPQL